MSRAQIFQWHWPGLPSATTFLMLQIISYRGAKAPVVELINAPACQLFYRPVDLMLYSRRKERKEGERKEGEGKEGDRKEVREREKKTRSRVRLNKEKERFQRR